MHHAVIALKALAGRRPRLRLCRLYALVAAVSYGLTLLSGALLYPRYRYFVRGLYLDKEAPWASNLFDFKENLATLGLPLAIGAWLIAWGLPRKARVDGSDRQVLLLYGFFALGTALITLFNVASGLLVASVHGI